MLNCQAHDRTHCPEPRCHVLAVCWASVPAFDGQSYPTTWRRWAWLRDHGYQEEKRAATLQIAARLVAWMRWDGALPYQACEGTCVRAYHGHGSCESCRGFGRVPGQHPLDAVMAHADRVTTLRRVCRQCMTERARNGALLARMYDDGLLPPEVLRVWPSDQCTHDGINWATVARVLDMMQDLGISLDVVHEWRPPIADTNPQEPRSLWTDRHFQAMATRYPFSWPDIREAATVWREWLDVEIPRDTLETLCAMAARSNMLPATCADTAARLERMGRESRL